MFLGEIVRQTSLRSQTCGSQSRHFGPINAFIDAAMQKGSKLVWPGYQRWLLGGDSMGMNES